MKKVLIAALGLLTTPALAYTTPQPSVYVNNATGKSSPGEVMESLPGVPATKSTPLSPMQKGVSVATATSLTVPTGATMVEAICTVGVNWEDDGGTPTATYGSGGMNLNAGTLFSYSLALANIKFISQSGAGTCSFSYYK